MLQRIIHFSVNNKLVIGLLILAWIICGIYAMRRLPLDAIPDITNNQVVIATQSPNLSSAEMESFVTYPVEMAMQNIQGLVHMRSVSQFGISLVTLEFEDKLDIYFLRAQVLERLQQIQIDPSFGKPQMLPITTGLGEIYQYTVRAKNPRDTAYSLTDLRTIQDWVIKKKLLGTKGVADVSSFGGYVKQYHISVDPLQLRGNNTTLEEVYKAVSESNNNTGASYIEKRGRNYFIRGIGLLATPAALNDVVIKMNGKIPVRIRDVGTVEEGAAIRYGALTQNGHEAVGGIIMMLKGANSNETIKNIKERLHSIQASLPQGLEIVPFLDRQRLIDGTIHTVSRNLIEGGLIVIFVLVLMLGHWQAGWIVASVIPLSMLFAISMMVFFGVSGNLMSLGAIDFGLIVDGAVIIVENVVVLLNRKLPSSLNRQQVVADGSSKMLRASILGQAIILIVYVPLLSLTGIEGKTFTPMVLTVIFALCGAIILSLTFVPMMSALLLKPEKAHKKNYAVQFISFLLRYYTPALRFVLHRRKTMLFTALALFAGAVFLFMKMGGEFVPQLDEGDYALQMRMQPGTSLTDMIRVSELTEKKILAAFPNEVKMVTGKIGTSEIPTDPMTIEEEDMIITMYPKEHWKKFRTRAAFESALEIVLKEIPGVSFSFQQPISMRFNELMTGAKSDVIVKIFGNDLSTLANLGAQAVSLIEPVSGAKDVVMVKAEELPQLFVTFDRQALMRYGLSVSEVNSVLQMAISGKYATTYFVDNQRFEVLVKLHTQIKSSFENIGNILVATPLGLLVPLKELATIAVQEGPMAIFRSSGMRNVNVSLNARERDVQSVVEDIQQKLASSLHLPQGYYLSYGGQFENLKNASDRLKIVVPISLFIIFLLLYFSFRSFTDTLIIFTAIPFAAIGGVVALYVRDLPFSISAGVGFIALFGVAVLNGMVLISYLNELKKENKLSLDMRIIKGVQGRFRAVLMTATVASLGFIPMAVGTGSGAEVQQPLASVVIGGLISATLLTLFLLPAIYKIIYGK